MLDGHIVQLIIWWWVNIASLVFGPSPLGLRRTRGVGVGALGVADGGEYKDARG